MQRNSQIERLVGAIARAIVAGYNVNFLFHVFRSVLQEKGKKRETGIDICVSIHRGISFRDFTTSVAPEPMRGFEESTHRIYSVYTVGDN